MENDSVRSEEVQAIGENGGGFWQWKKDDYCPQKDSNFDISLWDGVTQNEEDLSCMLEETTPIKACGDLIYHVTDHGNIYKETGECRETSSLVKRRRMLQFNSQAMQPVLCSEEMSSSFLNQIDLELLFTYHEGRESIIEEALPDTSPWALGFPGNISTPGDEDLDQLSERWIANCFNDADFNADDMNLSEISDVQLNVTELCDNPIGYEANLVQEPATRTPRNVIFKGRKFFMHTPTKLPSSVAYPFAFIKPCGVHGDVTLKDINQRIRTPPLSKSKQSNEDPSVSYPTSAFSGKPVVGKTKIRTEGGKGSITIMRTKG